LAIFNPKVKYLELNLQAKGNFNRKSRMVVTVSIVTILLWLTSPLHQIPSAIIALLAGGLFFSLNLLNQNDLKKTLQRGIADNSLELALRGKPRSPFYMVGRMNGQNVVIRAEKGKVRMMVDEDSSSKELVYDMKKEESSHDIGKEDQGSAHIYSQGETQSRTVSVDGAPYWPGNLPGDERQLGSVGSLAESGNGRDAFCLGAEERADNSIERAPGEAHGEGTFFPEREPSEIGEPSECGTEETSENKQITKTEDNEQKQEKTGTGQSGKSTAAGRDYYESPFRTYYGYRGSYRIRYLP